MATHDDPQLAAVPEDMELKKAENALSRAMQKIYLGDGAYVYHDGYHFILTTENGIMETNRVALDPYVLSAFMARVEELNRALEEYQRIMRMREAVSP